MSGHWTSEKRQTAAEEAFMSARMIPKSRPTYIPNHSYLNDVSIVELNETIEPSDGYSAHQIKDKSAFFARPSKLAPMTEDPEHEDLGPHVEWDEAPAEVTGEDGEKKLAKVLVMPHTTQTQIVAEAKVKYAKSWLSKKPYAYPVSQWTLQYTSTSDVAGECTREELEEFLTGAFSAISIDEVVSLRRKALLRPMILAGLLVIIGIIVAVSASAPGGAVVCALGVAAFIVYRIYLKRCMRKLARANYKALIVWIKANRGPLYKKGVKPRPGYNACFVVFEANYGPTSA